MKAAFVSLLAAVSLCAMQGALAVRPGQPSGTAEVVCA